MKLTKATTVLFSMLPKVFSESVSLRIQENGEETGGIPLDWIQEAHSNPCLWFLPEDIGSVGIEGCTDALGNATFGFDGDFTFHTGPLQMKGSGSGLGNNNDEFHMFRSYLPSWDLDFEIKASNLASATHQAGIMMRESTHSNSKHVSVLIKGDGALVQAARSQNGGDTVFTEEPGVTGEGNTWLRLRKTLKLSCKWVKKGWWPFYECRSDFHIRSYYKKDNIDWTQFGGTQVLTMNAFNDNIFGIGVTSNDNSELAVLNVPEVKVTLGTQDQALLSSTLDEESCAPSARKIRLHLSSPVDDIEAFEFHVTFSGEALELLASDNDFNGSSAVERQMMELPGLKDNTSMGLELDLGKSFSVESVSIVGRECVESNDPDCLCPINGATLSLVGDSGEDIASIDIGEDACGKAKMEYVIDASPEFCASSIEDYAVPAPAPAGQNILPRFGQKQRKLGRHPCKG